MTSRLGMLVILYPPALALSNPALPTGDAPDSADNNVVEPRHKKTVEGELTHPSYVLPPGRSSLEVIRNYQDDIKAQNKTVLYECKGLPDDLRSSDKVIARYPSIAHCSLSSMARLPLVLIAAIGCSFPSTMPGSAAGPVLHVSGLLRPQSAEDRRRNSRGVFVRHACASVIAPGRAPTPPHDLVHRDVGVSLTLRTM